MTMEKYLKSYTIVPEEYYVERSADKQIVNVIDDMGRPGYVLVARQMGKTNLLIHAKKKLENDRNIFVYLDFSVIPIYDDKSFFELLINKAIEERKDIFAEAKQKIVQLRKERIYDSVNQYTAELIILLGYVNKIVFVLDEIDALTKSKYSDNIFSQIRSDYFQRVNYEALNKVTYILSGVFEPKDLIKDPNISPFNIGEKIYLRSFNKNEMSSFFEKTGLDFSDEVKGQIYYWTNGHPRMLNDLCRDLQYENNLTVEDVDSIVARCYLETFDRAPMDGIRRNVESDTLLRDAVMQLHMAPDNLDIDVKQKLYLAGIGDYQGVKFSFRNPIIKASLPIQWLKSLSDRKRDVLRNVSELIYFQNNYNDAIELLKKYVSLGEADQLQLNEAFYYLGLCYFRKYETDESQRYLDRINVEVGGDGFETVMNSYLIKGYNYSNMSMPEECLRSYDMIIAQKGKVSWELYAKAYIGKADALINGDNNDVLMARKLMSSFINTSSIDNYYGYRAISYYELSAIEERLGNKKKANEYIEEATHFATTTEMPTLLYYKLTFLEDKKQKRETIEELLSYLKSFDKKPEIEDFDKMLNLNFFTLACIMAEIILFHEDFVPRFEPFLKWFNSSKEAAYNSIMKYLRNFNDTNTKAFAEKILALKKEGWLFGSDHIFNALVTIYMCQPSLKNALVLYDYIEKNNYTDNRKDVAHALIRVTKEFIETGRLDKAQKVINFYRTQFAEPKDTLVNALSIINDYYETIIMIDKESLETAKDYADRFINRVETITDEELELLRPMNREGLKNMCDDVRRELYNLQSAVLPKTPIVNNKKYGRNEIVTAVYFSDGHKVTTKFKNVRADYENNLCRIEKEVDS